MPELNAADVQQQIAAGAAALGVEVDASQCERMGRYLGLIQKWGKVYNLTSVRDPQEMLTHHLLDSLAAVPPLLRQRKAAAADAARPFSLLDVGAGAGLPGVVVAICCPQAGVTCVDTVAKKAAFQQQVALELRLPNLKGLHARVETLSDPFDVVASRAFASLSDFTRWSVDAVAPDGVWMAMKGKHPSGELDALPPDIRVFHVEQLTVPGLDADRCIVWMRRACYAL
ncbi:16S rRNA (guanine(527)-N(7))-methyltransferase RsmG [Xylophilus ampelinus]|uniref:Ribosomal RNA small subunit methyltransferase G n=1 Tax=Xylophilus ampelinus TaxID=54067 RepID=A0A318SHR7_9BURK|nr:16S rRNA (guanine(527)-N(7))-methyltransferase RsmG [Xylophilus ampelinus]MCS4510055.1 16S rRNA (guanine(527)-N(7))-methyltransferase RsmG [Xylophilus ampelinus]PYE78363.1 16S rRNA m(7)G-527 methyltransferase [Xylophilus ampelinus]